MEDSFLVLFRDGKQIWSADSTNNYPNDTIKLTMQDDGNAVLAVDGRLRWESKSGGKGASSPVLVLQDDGNLTIRSAGTQIWSSKSSKYVLRPRGKTDRLEAGQYIKKGEFLVSPNGKFKFTLDHDGVLFLWGEVDPNHRIWEMAKYRDEVVDMLVMQDDGDLALFAFAECVNWSSGTEGRGNATSTFVLQDDGNAVIFSDGKEIWATNTRQRGELNCLNAGDALYYSDTVVSPNKRFQLRMQSDGNLVLYDGSHPTWASITALPRDWPGSANLNDDGSLSVGPWNSNTRRRPTGGKAVLTVTDNGDVVIKSDDLTIWSTNESLIQYWEREEVSIQLPHSSA